MAIAALASAARPVAIEGAKLVGIMVGVGVAYGVALPIAFRAFKASAKVTDTVLDAPGKGASKFRSWRQARRDAKAPNTTEVVDLNGVPVAEAA